MKANRFRVYAQKDLRRNSVEILFAEHGADGRAYLAQPLVFTEVPEGDIPEPTFRIRTQEAQDLMDALWEVGLRPTEGQGSAGSLAATERHLADMREIVKKQGLL